MATNSYTQVQCKYLKIVLKYGTGLKYIFTFHNFRLPILICNVKGRQWCQIVEIARSKENHMNYCTYFIANYGLDKLKIQDLLFYTIHALQHYFNDKRHIRRAFQHTQNSTD